MKYDKTRTLEVTVVLALGISLIYWISGNPNVRVLFMVLTGVTAVAAVWPRLLTPVTWLWFRIGHVMGFVTNKILLGAVFFVLLTPLSALRRLAGKKAAPATDTAWIQVNKQFGPQDLDRQF
ncbi:MAG: hypothetical protein K1X47_12740 [Cyclobacteriaceae bacterium]|nr:hypothetical protein [Cyclobacteriaceae bacterium]